MSIVLTATPVSKTGQRIFESALQASVTLPAVAANQTLPSVTIPSDAIPSGATITRVLAAIAWRKQADTSGVANAVDGAQNIQVQNETDGIWTTAIAIADGALATVADTTEGGTLVVGARDIDEEVTGAGTYEFRWALALVDGASLVLTDVQTFLIVEFTTST